MVAIERLKKNGKAYYYISKNFRIGQNKFKKIRKYFGSQKPTKEDIKKAASQIEKEAEKAGLMKKKQKYRYLAEDEAEIIDEIKDSFFKWKKRLPPESVEKFDADFLVRFTYNSNAIEGNTLSLRDTHLILQDNIIPADASTYEYNEVINSRETIAFIKKYKGEVNKGFILQVQKLLTKNTLVKNVGRYRNHNVVISGSKHIPPDYTKLDKEMTSFFVWYSNNKKRIHPLELACIAHTKLVRIHPFSDGNGRTARIMSNFILFRREYPLFVVENRDRNRYYHALEQSDAGNERDFVKFIFDNIIEQFKATVGRNHS